MTGIGKVVQFVVFWLLVVLIGVSMTFSGSVPGTVGGVALLALVPLYYFLVFQGSDGRAAKAREKLQSTLMKEEIVLAEGLQLRLFALFSRRRLVAVTNSRLIEIQRSIFGGFSMKDYQWKDLRDARMSENILPNLFGAKLQLVSRVGTANIAIDGLMSATASAIYSLAQAKEQEWEEKNRIRDLEEKRAMSGASFVTVGGPASTPSDGGDMFASLEKAKKLFDSGAIGDVEYQELKAKIINKGA